MKAGGDVALVVHAGDLVVGEAGGGKRGRRPVVMCAMAGRW